MLESQKCILKAQTWEDLGKFDGLKVGHYT